MCTVQCIVVCIRQSRVICDKAERRLLHQAERKLIMAWISFPPPRFGAKSE